MPVSRWAMNLVALQTLLPSAEVGGWWSRGLVPLAILIGGGTALMLLAAFVTAALLRLRDEGRPGPHAA